MNIVFFVENIFSEKYVGEISRKNNEGVLERPGTKWKVLNAIYSTLKCQFSGKRRKVDFSMPCKTKSAENLHVWPYARSGHPGNPQTSPISTWIVKKTIFVNFRIFCFLGPRGLVNGSPGVGKWVLPSWGASLHTSAGLLFSLGHPFTQRIRGFSSHRASLHTASGLLFTQGILFTHGNGYFVPARSKNWKNRKFTKICFLTIQVEIGEVWGFPRWPDRSYGHTCKFSADFIVHGIENSTFLHFPENWFSGKLNSSPILLFCPRNPKSSFFENKKDARRKMIEIRQNKSWFSQLWCNLVSNRIPVFESIFGGFEPKNLWAFLLGMENQGNISVFFPFLFSNDFPWISHEFPIDFSMVFPMVFALDFPWIFHGSIFHDLSMNYKMFPWWFPVPLLA